MSPYKSPDEIRREQINRKYAELSVQQAAVEATSRQETNPQNQLKLEQQSQVLLQRLEKLDEELKQLDKKSSNSKQRCLVKLDEVLPKINFTDAKTIFTKITAEFGEQGGCAVFLLQKSLAMQGELCLKEMRNLLKRTEGFECYPVEFQFYPIGFDDNSGLPLNEWGLLERLARHLEVKSSDNIIDFSARIRKVLFEPPRSNRTIFIEISGWDDIAFDRQQVVLSWFLETFWRSLVDEHRRHSQDYSRVRLIVVIVTYGEISSDCHCFCSFNQNVKSQNFVVEETVLKAIDLPLKDWTVDEIRVWLEATQGLSKHQSKSLARTIYQRTSNGHPRDVYHVLEKKFRQADVASEYRVG